MPGASQPRYRVEVEEGPAHGDLYELEQMTFFRVIDTCSNTVILAYAGEMSARLDGGVWSDHQYSGVSDLIVAPDERSIRVKYHGGREEIVALPA